MKQILIKNLRSDDRVMVGDGAQTNPCTTIIVNEIAPGMPIKIPVRVFPEKLLIRVRNRNIHYPMFEVLAVPPIGSWGTMTVDVDSDEITYS